MIRPGTPLSRGLALLLLAGLAGLVWLGAVAPLAAWKTTKTTALAEAREESQKLRQTIVRLEAERVQLSGDGTAEIVWSAPRLGEAAAQVQARIGELAREGGLVLRSITPVPPRELPLTGSVGFRLESEATLDRLVEFLVVLEYHSPILAIDRATLRRLVRPGAPSEQPTLFVQFEIVAPAITPGEERR